MADHALHERYIGWCVLDSGEVRCFLDRDIPACLPWSPALQEGRRCSNRGLTSIFVG